DALGINEEDVLARLRNMIDNGLIRRLGGIFDSRMLGYHSTLCAMQVDENRIGEVAAVVNSYPGVTHNYLREHKFNMWFTSTAPSKKELDEFITKIKKDTGINDILVLPAQKLFKIRVNFDL
ncbi:MAG: Lrp/AsnC family transcriptional regulator, partial [Desulfotomaculaceae bacterium]|nr:Lrp/AsnC family transcriptional regulator [Desulfotomaculaceae bacterium]